MVDGPNYRMPGKEETMGVGDDNVVVDEEEFAVNRDDNGDNDADRESNMVSLLDLASATLASSIVAAEHIRALAQHHDDNNGDDDTTEKKTTVDRKNVRLKADGSYVTNADVASQHIIVDALRNVSDQVRLVGEESEEDMKGHTITGHEDRLATIFQLARQEVWIRYERLFQPLPLVSSSSSSSSSTEAATASCNQPTLDQEMKEEKLLVHNRMEDYNVDPRRVSVFIDPLDGTKAYAKGDYDPVSVLIAIILDQAPCFGVICKPFGYTGQVEVLDTGCVAIYGGTLLGAAYTAGGSCPIMPIGQQQQHKLQQLHHPISHDTAATPAPTVPKCDTHTTITESSCSEGSSDAFTTQGSQTPSENYGVDHLPRAVISSSRSKGIVEDFVTHLGDKGMINPTPLLISGAGEKSLRIILRSENEGLWFFPKAGTSLWDVAASDALLRATGGRLTDKNGNDMDYSKTRTEAENEDGVVACYDHRLHAECIQLFLDGSWNES